MVASAPASSPIALSADDEHDPAGQVRIPRPRLFGQFLVERGVVTRPELGEALTLMRALNSSIGELAVAHGLVTRAQAEQIHSLQRQVDGRWGEIAVALGIGGATAQRIERLAWEQDLANLRLSDAIVELGFASATEIDRLHAEFEDAAPTVASDIDALLDGVPRLIGRTLGSPVRVGAPRPHEGSGFAHHVEIAIAGPTPIALGLSTDRQLARAIAVALPEGRDPSARAGGRIESALAALAVLVAEQVRRRLDTRDKGHALGSPRAGALPSAGTAIELALADGEALLVLAGADGWTS